MRVTPIMEDLAELKLSSSKKTVKDDNDIPDRSRKLQIVAEEEEEKEDEVVKQLDRLFENYQEYQPLLKEGKF